MLHFFVVGVLRDCNKILRQLLGIIPQVEKPRRREEKPALDCAWAARFATFPAKSTLGNSRSTVDEQAAVGLIRPA